ncbi:hypothetical protein BU16DRAFT_578227 [Lophium mytilinum]|uniref:Uncharacterized protein n=1 Tax=Lophium mytilinum TaxID=390894 RepID=A0A6A6R600_9PEZI|nr:hypothetical protein BU16DRAFT_578227 [Lophium mytilinum]
MARESHKNFLNTGFRSRDTNKLRFTSSTKGGTATPSAVSEDPLDFLDTEPAELEPPSSPFNLDLNSSRWITYGWILVTAVFLISLLYSYGPSIHKHLPLVTIPLETCGYRTDHFSFLADTPAEILGFRKQAVKLYDIAIASQAPNITASFDEFRELIAARHAALESFWFPVASPPNTQSGLEDAQIEWIVDRLGKAKTEMLSDVDAVADKRAKWHFRLAYATPHRDLSEKDLEFAAKQGMSREWLEGEWKKLEVQREGPRPVDSDFVRRQNAAAGVPTAAPEFNREGLKTKPVGFVHQEPDAAVMQTASIWIPSTSRDNTLRATHHGCLISNNVSRSNRSNREDFGLSGARGYIRWVCAIHHGCPLSNNVYTIQQYFGFLDVELGDKHNACYLPRVSIIQ